MSQTLPYDRSYIEQYLARFVRPKRPELEAPLLAAFDWLAGGSKNQENVLDALLDAASDRHAHVYDIGTYFLGEAAVRNPSAVARLEQMTASPLAHVRHNAVLCLTAKTPLAIRRNVLRMALADPSVRVRRKAADWAARLKMDIESIRRV